MTQSKPITAKPTDLQSAPRTNIAELSAVGRELSQDDLDWVAGGIKNCGPDGTVVSTPHGIYCD